jgi:uncharacterized protein (DUF1800 family)
MNETDAPAGRLRAMAFSFPPDQAWKPLAANNWNADTARHLLRRAGWSAGDDEVRQAVALGLGPTLDQLFPNDPPRLPRPASLDRLAESLPNLRKQARDKTGDERRAIERDVRELERVALQDLSLRWLAYAADPRQAAVAKWTLFLSDVYVVSAEKVKSPALIFDHFDTLARHGFGNAPALSKAVSRSPAMVMYLDLNQSQRKAPNENFARELFELFVLGEGNYTERDIKEAARAFTGYRATPLAEDFRFVPGQHDPTKKTVFGTTGAFSGDDVIDLAYRQPAAATFLPHELVKFYLSDTPLPREYLVTLGDEWRAAGFNLRWLAQHFFGSQLFSAPEFRGNFIKSPIQFYLGMLQDLHLSVPPLPRMSLNPLRQMGQPLFFPPNVRGWVGGPNWINSATIIARRQLVETLFAPINEKALNADELAELATARTAGAAEFTVSSERLGAFTDQSADDAATNLVHQLMGPSAGASVVASIAKFLSGKSTGKHPPLHAIRRAAATLLQSPEYQLT